jgi:integrase
MCRRSELAALNLEDVAPSTVGLDVTIRASKTDKDARGTVVGVPYGSAPSTCPVTLTQAWTGRLAALGHTTGPLFRPVDRYGHLPGDDGFAGRSTGPRMTGQAIEVIMRRALTRAGLTGYTPHSLRSGGATAAYRAGADPLHIARHGRWKDGSPVLLGYIQTGRAEDNPMRGLL